MKLNVRKGFLLIFVIQLLMNISLFGNDSTHVNLTGGRAMWIWDNNNIVTYMVKNIGNLRKNLFEFCKSPHGNSEHKISVLFLDCKGAVVDYPDSLRSFLSEASQNGFVVEYLDGAPSWATYNQAKGFGRIEKVLDFNRNSQTAEEKLQGIQFDVEPYLLKSTSSYNPPYWDVNMDSVWNLYYDYIDTCQTIIDQDNDDLYFGIAIPRWYENYVGIEELGRLQALTDYIAIMDYNEKASVIIRDAANEIDNAIAYDKKVWIGVETKNVSPETVSFYEEGLTFMEDALASVNAAYQDSSAYLGIAIHSYKYYSAMEYPNAIEPKIENNIEINGLLNFENPVRRGTTIQYNLAKPMRMEVTVYNMLGQVIEKLFSGTQYQGVNSVYWNASDYPSGIYFYQIKSKNFIQVRKMVVTH